MKSVCEFGVEGDILGEFSSDGSKFPFADGYSSEGSILRNRKTLPVLCKAISELGADFVVCSLWPEANIKSAIDKFRHIAMTCRQTGLNFFTNDEIINYSKDRDFLDEQGNDLIHSPDGCHRYDVSGKLLKSVSQIAEFRGALYDEAAHGQIRREHNTNDYGKCDGKVYPFFAATDGMSLQEAYDAVYHSAKSVADAYRQNGVSMLTEHVWPVMFHTFARAGIHACPKFMKESWNSVFAAIALGAAKQYGTEFCPSLDLWGLAGFPGHSVEEFRCSLLFAYWMGATKIFVENVCIEQHFAGLDSSCIHGSGLLTLQEEKGDIKCSPTEYGKIYRWFIKEYVPAHPRPYTFKEIKPEIGIIRFPDSYWGQKNSWMQDALYGAKNLPANFESVAWIGLWRLLTHNYSHKDGISFRCKSYRKSQHDFFCPLNNVVVYDHLVKMKDLMGLKLIFLTGVEISKTSLEAIKKFVSRGGLCVSLISLAPPEISKAGFSEVPYGKGKWILTKDFQTQKVRKIVAPYLGEPDEIRYRFGELSLIIKCGNNANKIQIHLQKKKSKDTGKGIIP